jgi:hypothetical protein
VDCADNQLAFRRFFADGTPAGPIVHPLPGYYYAYCYSSTKLVWNGAEYGAAFAAHDGSTFQAYFARLDAAGALVTPGGGDPPNPQRVSFVGVTPTTVNVDYPSLAWSGSGYAVAWQDMRNGSDQNIFATLLESNGAVAGGGAYHDITVVDSANNQFNPQIVWSPISRKYVTVWIDEVNGINPQVLGTSMATDTTLGGVHYIISGSQWSTLPTLVNAGNWMGMAHSDNRNGGIWDIYFTLLDSEGWKMTPEVQVSEGTVMAMAPHIAWTGVEFGVFWNETTFNGHVEVYMNRVSSLGSPLGAPWVVSYMYDQYFPKAAFGRYNYFLTLGQGAGFVMPLGCNADTTPPSCPANYVAYGITGAEATISWLPSTEDYTDIAYYQVYRDNIPLAITADSYYHDTGLGLNTTYNYAVRPVNAAQMENGACSDSIYVKTNASLILKLDKTVPNAHLFWTDGGMNNYNIFRGTSPQVMTKIGSTGQQETEDPNVLLDGVNYFYTVDDPGF